jgi:GcrA cell cycle regulator
MPAADWTEDDIALLRKLWSSGATADAIARQLGGISRSAVLGKIFRLRLPPAAGKAASSPLAAKPSGSPARRRGAEPLPAPKSDDRPKSLFELTNQCCRWPFRRPGTGKYFFCGLPEADLARGIP